jgi:hypothetical protein
MEFFAGDAGAMARDQANVTCLRSVLMKSEHLDWIDRIWAIVGEATQAASRAGGAHP